MFPEGDGCLQGAALVTHTHALGASPSIWSRLDDPRGARTRLTQPLIISCDYRPFIYSECFRMKGFRAGSPIGCKVVVTVPARENA